MKHHISVFCVMQNPHLTIIPPVLLGYSDTNHCIKQLKSEHQPHISRGKDDKRTDRDPAKILCGIIRGIFTLLISKVKDQWVQDRTHTSHPSDWKSLKEAELYILLQLSFFPQMGRHLHSSQRWVTIFGYVCALCTRADIGRGQICFAKTVN